MSTAKLSNSVTFDQQLDRIDAGESVAPDTIRELAKAADILPLGMLADAVRRRLHGSQATYVRVAVCPFDASFADAVPVAAREVRIGGHPPSFDLAESAVHAARAVAGGRVVSGLSWADVAGFAEGGQSVGRVLRALRDAGLDSLAELPIDAIEDPDRVIGMLKQAGFEHLRLTVDKLAAGQRVESFLRMAEWQARFGCVAAINPLPMSLNAFRPTTGYEDVKMVAVARLAVMDVAHVQVDWQRYGPKLAQVALTFGADDVDAVSASDDGTEGRRRAPLEEIRRNIQAAGFEPVERDGRFVAA
jgi:aminodeoxyfutalosine synthase